MRTLRVRTGHHYPIRFLVDLGQRNAIFIKRPLTPLNRLFIWADAVAPIPEWGHDLVHSVNAVPILTRRPYIISFEDYLPRVPEDRYIAWLERWLQRKLLSTNCVALLAMSEYALRQFRWQNRRFAGLPELENKTQLLYPALSVGRDRPKEGSRDRLRLLFVGKDFMRKGGPAVTRAHARLRAARIPVETTVVSSLRWSPKDYIGPAEGYPVEEEYDRLNQEGLTHRQGLPNPEVMALMESADYLLLPTFHDTFGYVSLEAMAVGTPVIATHTCAQPEIVEEGRSGFLLQFQNDQNVGKWAWIYRNREPGYNDAYLETIERLADALTERLTRCWELRRDYEALSAGALQRIRDRFDKTAARNRLEGLYETCAR